MAVVTSHDRKKTITKIEKRGITGLYPTSKSFWSCTHVNICHKYTLYIKSTYFIEYFMQGNFKNSKSQENLSNQ